jgi:hypothetical protein
MWRSDFMGMPQAPKAFIHHRQSDRRLMLCREMAVGIRKLAWRISKAPKEAYANGWYLAHLWPDEKLGLRWTYSRNPFRASWHPTTGCILPSRID